MAAKALHFMTKGPNPRVIKVVAATFGWFNAHIRWSITAALSIATVILLVPLLPQAIAIPSLVDLQEPNLDQEAQITARKRFDDSQVDAPFRHKMTAGIALAALLIGFLGFLYWRSAGGGG